MKLRDVKRLGIVCLCVSMLILPVEGVNATGTTYYGTGTTLGNNNVIGGTGTTAGNNSVVGGNNNNSGSNNSAENNSNSNNTDNNQQTTKPENTEKPESNNQNNSGNQQTQKPESDNNQQNTKPENTEKPIISEKPDNKDENNSEDNQKPNKPEEENKNDEQESAGDLGGNLSKEENPVPSVEEEEDWKSDSYDDTGTSVRGKVEGVPSTTEGSYLAKGVNGCAVLTSEAQIKQDYGLTDMDTVYAIFSDLNPEEKPVSAQMLQMAVSSQGAEVGSMLNIDLGKMNYGSYSRLSEKGAKIEIALGIPESFYDKNMTYGVVCIRKDGTMEVCRDTDSKQSTVTFQTKGGVGAYALYRYENEVF